MAFITLRGAWGGIAHRQSLVQEIWRELKMFLYKVPLEILYVSVLSTDQDQTQQQIDFTNAHLAYVAEVLLINPYLTLLVLSIKSPLIETNCTSCSG